MGVWTWDKLRAGYDMIRSRTRRGAGYSRVGEFEGALDDGDEGLLYLDD